MAGSSRAGAKMVLVGDAKQLQPIEAGAAFRAIAERIGVAEIETNRRQRDERAREASQNIAGGRAGAGLEAYRRRGSSSSWAAGTRPRKALTCRPVVASTEPSPRVAVKRGSVALGCRCSRAAGPGCVLTPIRTGPRP